MNDDLTFDLDALAVDVFTLTENHAVVESLTGAHGLTELAASCPAVKLCSGSCSFVEA